MSRHPVADGWKILLSLAAGPLAIGFVILLLVVAIVGSCNRLTSDLDLSIGAARDTVYITDTLYLQAKKEAAKHEAGTANAVAAAKGAGQLAQVMEPGKIALRLTPAAPPSVVIVPVQVTDLITKQQAAIDSLTLLADLRKKALDAADSTIRARDRLIAALEPDRCGKKCGFALGALSFGLAWKALH